MKHPSREPLKPQQAEITEDPTGVWAYGGYRFAGGKIGLGKNVEAIREWEYSRSVGPTPDIALGTLVLASVGWTNTRIAIEVGRSPSTIDGTIEGIRTALDVPQKFMILPAAIRDKILSLDEYGIYGFGATPYELAQIGLRARGVELETIANACGIVVGTLRGDFHAIGKGEGTPNLASTIAAATLNRKIGATSCVPLLRVGPNPLEVRPLMPVPVWNEMIATDDISSMSTMFTELEAA